MTSVSVIRPAAGDDAAAVAEVFLRSTAAALPTVRQAHTDDQVRGWITRLVIPAGRTWVIVADGVVAGMMTVEQDCIEHLYLDPDDRGTGLGDLLVEHAKTLSPAGLWLWTFQVNLPAIRFYQRHGFRETLRTDGSHNDEREPDVLLEWAPRT